MKNLKIIWALLFVAFCSIISIISCSPDENNTRTDRFDNSGSNLIINGKKYTYSNFNKSIVDLKTIRLIERYFFKA